MEADQAGLLVLTGGHVLQYSYYDLAEGGATFAGTALGVLGPVEVVHLEVSFVLALGVALGIAGAWLWAVAGWCAHGSPPMVNRSLFGFSAAPF